MKRLNQQGAAAILSVLIFSIIITVVVTAYLRSALSGQAEAMNFDLSTRAYYAAESGIQDALREINTNPSYTSKNTCDAFVPSGSGNLDSSGYLAYTCQLIDITPSSIEFTVGQDTNGMARLLPANTADFNGTYNLIVRWSSTADSGANNYTTNDSTGLFPPQAKWSEDSRYPALRVSLISFPVNSGSTGLSSSNVRQDVVFLNPTAETDVTMNINATTGVTPEARVQSAHCYDSESIDSYGGYKCQKVIKLTGYPLDTNALYARLHSLYSSSKVQLSLAKDGSTDPVPLKGGVIQIDVTGKAGNVLKRVRQTYNLQDGVMLDNLPEAAVIGGDGICKYYSITNQEAGFKNLGACY